MAFKITKKPIFTAQVEVYTPNEKCGHDLSKFTARFNRIDMHQLDKLREKKQPEVMREVLAGWEDFNDEENNPVPFTPENLETLINIPEALQGLSLAFWENVVKGRTKN